MSSLMHGSEGGHMVGEALMIKQGSINPGALGNVRNGFFADFVEIKQGGSKMHEEGLAILVPRIVEAKRGELLLKLASAKGCSRALVIMETELSVNELGIAISLMLLEEEATIGSFKFVVEYTKEEGLLFSE